MKFNKLNCKFFKHNNYCDHKDNLDRRKSISRFKLKPKRCLENFCPLLEV